MQLIKTVREHKVLRGRYTNWVGRVGACPRPDFGGLFRSIIRSVAVSVQQPRNRRHPLVATTAFLGYT